MLNRVVSSVLFLLVMTHMKEEKNEREREKKTSHFEYSCFHRRRHRFWYFYFVGQDKDVFLPNKKNCPNLSNNYSHSPIFSNNHHYTYVYINEKINDSLLLLFQISAETKNMSIKTPEIDESLYSRQLLVDYYYFLLLLF